LSHGPKIVHVRERTVEGSKAAHMAQRRQVRDFRLSANERLQAGRIPQRGNAGDRVAAEVQGNQDFKKAKFAREVRKPICLEAMSIIAAEVERLEVP
jgi:hypothetical protein